MSSPQQNNHRSFELPTQDSPYAYAEQPAPRKKGCGCCCLGCGLGCFGFILLVVIGLGIFWYSIKGGAVPLVVSPETTVITEPLKSDGKSVDFYQAIQKMTEPDIDDRENGFRDVLLNYGREVFEYGKQLIGTVDDREFQYQTLCNRLIIDRNAAKFSLKETDQAKWDAGLDSVQEALSKPYYFIPLTDRLEEEDALVLTSYPYYTYQFHAELAKAFKKRAESRQLHKDVQGAWEDTLAVIRLYRLVTFWQEWITTLEGKDMGVVYMQNRYDLAVGSLSMGGTSEQLKQAIEDLESLPDWQDRETTLKMMQYTLLDMLSVADNIPELISRLNQRQSLPNGQWVPEVGFDMNLLAQEFNKRINDYREGWDQEEDSLRNLIVQWRLRRSPEENPFDLGKQEYWNEVGRKAAQKLMQEGTSVNPLKASGRSSFVGAVTGALIVQGAAELYRLQMIEETHLQALRLDLALTLYRREHGKFPDSLEQLGLKPLLPDMEFRYSNRGNGYEIQSEFISYQRRIGGVDDESKAGD